MLDVVMGFYNISVCLQTKLPDKMAGKELLFVVIAFLWCYFPPLMNISPEFRLWSFVEVYLFPSGF